MAANYVSPYLQRHLRDLEEVRQRQILRQALEVAIGEALSEAKAAGHALPGQIDLAAHAALRLRPNMNALDALGAVERVRRRGNF